MSKTKKVVENSREMETTTLILAKDGQEPSEVRVNVRPGHIIEDSLKNCDEVVIPVEGTNDGVRGKFRFFLLLKGKLLLTSSSLNVTNRSVLCNVRSSRSHRRVQKMNIPKDSQYFPLPMLQPKDLVMSPPDVGTQMLGFVSQLLLNTRMS